MANHNKKITVIGAGSWGTALAIVLADNGFHVNLWTRKEEQMNELNEKHTNGKYLPGINLPVNIHGSTFTSNSSGWSGDSRHRGSNEGD